MRIPKPYHHASGQLRLRIDGHDYYCGVWGTPEAEAEAARKIAEWKARGLVAPRPRCSVNELCLRFLRHAEIHYTKHGKPTGEWWCYKTVVRHLRLVCGDLEVGRFDVARLKQFRTLLQEREPAWSRQHVNEQVARVRRIFRWGHEEGAVPLEIVSSLDQLAGLRKGKAKAPESRGRKRAVSIETVEATLPHLRPPILQKMLRLHRLIGCRAAEICLLRPCDIDREADPTGQCWLWRPWSYKQEQQVEHDVAHWLGPTCQTILLGMENYVLDIKAVRYLFITRRGKVYCKDSYGLAIARACRRAGIPRWSPGQIRKLRASEIEEHEYAAGRRGREGAQAVLSHTSPSATDHYLERLQLARKIQAQLG